MELKARLLNYITNHYPISDTKLMAIATSKGYSESEVYQALEEVGRDKSIKTRLKGEVIWYEVVLEPIKIVQKADWSVTHYPWPGKNGVPEFVMPFPEISYEWMYLRTKEERDEYRAAASGRPLHLVQKQRVRYGKTGE